MKIHLTEPALSRTLEAMRKRGGNFAKSLALTMWAADPDNRARLALAFPEVFARYQEAETSEIQAEKAA